MKIENLYYRHEGRLFRATALFAMNSGPVLERMVNQHLLDHPDEAVLVTADSGLTVILADKNDGGLPFPSAHGITQHRVDQVRELREALKPFAEPPSPAMDEYPCHQYIFTNPRQCGRCGRALRAWDALEATKWAEAPTGETP